MAVEGYRQAGDIELNTIALVGRSGQIFDLSELMLEMNIYQNLYEKEMTCELVISDATGLIDFLKPNSEDIGGFSGMEAVFLSYRTPDEGVQKNRHLFIMNSLESRQSVDERIETYVLTGTSLETVLIADKKISRSYGGTKGNTISNMIKSIHREFYETPEITQTYANLNEANFRVFKDLELDNTVGLQKYVIPNLSVEDTIDFLTNEAKGDDIASLYTFYEDSNGYHFKNISNLVEGDVKETYKWEPSNYTEGGDNAAADNTDAFKIIAYEVVKEVDFLDNKEGGLYASKTILIDNLRKKMVERDFDYKKQHDKFKKLQRFRIPGAASSTAVVDMFTTRFQHDQLSIFRDENVRPKTLERTIQYRRSYASHLNNKVIEVTIHGNSTLNVGDTIFLSFPVMSTGEEQMREDKYMTGKHLITTLRHKIDKETHVTVIECIKDTGFKR